MPKVERLTIIRQEFHGLPSCYTSCIYYFRVAEVAEAAEAVALAEVPMEVGAAAVPEAVAQADVFNVRRIAF